MDEAETARALRTQLAETQQELETERHRLVACSVAALGYFRGCAPEYHSAALDDVLKLVEEVERLRERLQNASGSR